MNRDARRQATQIAERVVDELLELPNDTARYEYIKVLRQAVHGIDCIDCYRCREWPCKCADGITLLHASIDEVVHQVSGIDYILTDPPYGMNYANSRTRRRIFGDESVSTFARSWGLCLATLRPDRYWTVFAGSQASTLADFLEIVGDCYQLAVWDKANGGLGDLTGGQLRLACEHLIFGWRGEKRGLKGERFNVFRHKIPDKKRHPHAKPVELCRDLIVAATEPGERVFDPFAGSGATLLAAKELERTAVGVEIEAEYCELIKERLEARDGPQFKVV